MMYPLVRDLAAADAPARVPAAVACRVLGFSKQAYYAWLKEPVSPRDWDDAHLINAASAIHADEPAFARESAPPQMRSTAEMTPTRGGGSDHCSMQ